MPDGPVRQVTRQRDGCPGLLPAGPYLLTKSPCRQQPLRVVPVPCHSRSSPPWDEALALQDLLSSPLFLLLVTALLQYLEKKKTKPTCFLCWFLSHPPLGCFSSGLLQFSRRCFCRCSVELGWIFVCCLCWWQRVCLR